MDLITPGIGLLFWTALIFLCLFFILRKFAFPFINKALQEREEAIENSLHQAEKAKDRFEELTKKTDFLLLSAKKEREDLLNEAHCLREKIIEEARNKTKVEYDRLMDNARQNIEHEKKAAIASIKNEISDLAIEVAEKVLERELKDKETQRNLIENWVNELKI